MTTSAKIGYGTTLSWNGNTVAEVTNLSGPNMKKPAVNVGDYSQAWDEFIAGKGDGGELKLELNFYPGDTDGQYAMYTDFKAGTARAVVLTGPTAAAFSFSFTGLITDIEPSYPQGDAMKAAVTIKVSGEPTMNLTTSTGISALTGIEENTGAALVFVPAFDIATFAYNVAVNTASDWVKLTVTAESHTIKVSIDGGEESTLTTTVQSSELALGVADTQTVIRLRVYESGKIALNYYLYVGRPAA